MANIMRTLRLAARIRQDLTEILFQEVTDPALLGITITDVEVDRELAFAKIFVSTLEGSERKKEVLAGLERARGFLRHQLTQRIELRTFPQLRFKWDGTAERAQRIELLLKQIASEPAPGEPIAQVEDEEEDMDDR